MTDVVVRDQPESEVDEARERSKIGHHPDRDKIEALLRRGKSASWISLWLEEVYPLEGAPEINDDGDEIETRHELFTAHEKLQLTPALIDEYRKKFMPEAMAGFGLSEDLEDQIGRRFPAPKAIPFELDVAEAGVRAAEMNLARALSQDAEMGMVQPTTLQAQDQLMNAANTSLDMKSKLGLEGYEAAPDRIEQKVDQTNRNFSVELHGSFDPRSGEAVPTEPDKVDLLRKLMELPAEKAADVLAGAAALHAAVVVDGEATEEPVDSASTEIPVDDEFDEPEERADPGGTDPDRAGLGDLGGDPGRPAAGDAEPGLEEAPQGREPGTERDPGAADQ